MWHFCVCVCILRAVTRVEKASWFLSTATKHRYMREIRVTARNIRTHTQKCHTSMRARLRLPHVTFASKCSLPGPRKIKTRVTGKARLTLTMADEQPLPPGPNYPPAYPPQQPVYPPQQQAYPPQQPGYPPQQPGYQPQQPGYPPQPAQAYPPQQLSGYPATQPLGYTASPPPYQPQPVPQATQQSSANVVVVQQQPQPVVTTTVYTRHYGAGDHGLAYAIIASCAVFWCAGWVGLVCTIPAIFLSLNAQQQEYAGNLEVMKQHHNWSMILSTVGLVVGFGTLILWIIVGAVR